MGKGHKTKTDEVDSLMQTENTRQRNNEITRMTSSNTTQEADLEELGERNVALETEVKGKDKDVAIFFSICYFGDDVEVAYARLSNLVQNIRCHPSKERRIFVTSFVRSKIASGKNRTRRRNVCWR